MNNQSQDSTNSSIKNPPATIDQIMDLEGYKWEWYKFVVNLMNGMPAVRAYADAYKHDIGDYTDKQYKHCSFYAHQLLKNNNFIEFRRRYLIATGWNDESVDGVTLEIMFDKSQPATARLSAVDQFNKISGRHIKKIQHSGTIRNENVDMPKGVEDVLDDIEGRSPQSPDEK